MDPSSLGFPLSPVSGERGERSSSAQAGVIRNLMADEQREGRLGQLVQRPGPRMKVNEQSLVQEAELVVELADGHVRERGPQSAEQFRQRVVAEHAGVVPALQLAL